MKSYSPPDKSIWGYIHVCTTKAEQARHKILQLVEQLKSWRARGELILALSFVGIALSVARSKSQTQQTEKQKSTSGLLEVMDQDNASGFYQATVDPAWPMHKWYTDNDKDTWLFVSEQ